MLQEKIFGCSYIASDKNWILKKFWFFNWNSFLIKVIIIIFYHIFIQEKFLQWRYYIYYYILFIQCLYINNGKKT